MCIRDSKKPRRPSSSSDCQRSHYTKRRKEIWLALHPYESNSGATCADIQDRGRGRPQEFASETSSVTGESKSQINRHIARAEALGDDINRVVGTSLDKGVELDALAKMPEPERKEIWLALHPDEIAVAQGVPPQNASPMARPQDKGFAASAALITGESKTARKGACVMLASFFLFVGR